MDRDLDRDPDGRFFLYKNRIQVKTSDPEGGITSMFTIRENMTLANGHHERKSLSIMSDGALDQHDKTKVFTQLKLSCPVISCCSF